MIKKFFILCSGADSDILNKCIKATQIKYVGIGATIFFTAIMAFIASSYALFTVFDNYYTAIFFGLVWGLLIFNLDRFIVSTIKKSDHKRKEFYQATPRIILAIIIAVVISKPLELKIFEKEVNQVLLTKKNDLTAANKIQIASQFLPEITKLETEIAQLKQDVTLKESETNQLYETYITEAEGTRGTKLLGKGPVYEEKREKHDAALIELQELKKQTAIKVTEKEAQIINLKEIENNKITSTQPIIDNFDGLMARINALSELPMLPSLFIFLLFLAIETSPIISKLIAQKDEYDLKLEDLENSVKVWVAQNQHQRQKLLQTDTALNEAIYNELANDNDLYYYKKKKAAELLQLQADSFHKKQQQVMS